MGSSIDNSEVLAGINALLGDYVEYDVAGTYTLIVPEEIKRIVVTACGAGGGGGGGGSFGNGGNGGNSSSGAKPGDGTFGGGGGGAGACSNSTGGKGGDGIVIIKWGSAL